MDQPQVRFTPSNPSQTPSYSPRDGQQEEAQNPYKIALSRLTGNDDFQIEERTAGDNDGSFPCFRFIINNISMVLYILDVWTDISLVVKYYLGNDIWWFGLTLSFVALPTLINGSVVVLYMMQRKETVCFSIVSLVATVLQIAPILRYLSINLLLFRMWRGSESQLSQRRQINDSEGLANFWRMVECFAEALPQLCLQIYILSLPDRPSPITADSDFIEHASVGFQSACIVTSLASAGWTLLSLNLWLYEDTSIPLTNKTAIPIMLHGLWFFLMLASRVLAIALSATYFRGWIFIMLIIHWLVLFVYHYLKTKARLVYIIVQAWASMFYLTYTEQSDELDGGYIEVVQWGHIFFYVMVYVENAIMIITWYLFTQTLDLWYHGYALAVVLGGYLIGALCQLIYFVWYDGRWDRAKRKVRDSFQNWGKNRRKGSTERDRETGTDQENVTDL